VQRPTFSDGVARGMSRKAIEDLIEAVRKPYEPAK
jgi:hypothetical protein